MSKKQNSPMTDSRLEDSKDKFLVFVRSQVPVGSVGASTGDRGAISDKMKQVGQVALESIQIDPEALQAELSNFLAKMDVVLHKLPVINGGYTLDTIEMSLEITAKGAIGFLGTGGELSGMGGLKLTLRRANAGIPKS